MGTKPLSNYFSLAKASLLTDRLKVGGRGIRLHLQMATRELLNFSLKMTLLSGLTYRMSRDRRHMVASQDGREAVAKLLLTHDDITTNTEVKSGMTALYFASKNGHQTVVQLLLSQCCY